MEEFYKICKNMVFITRTCGTLKSSVVEASPLGLQILSFGALNKSIRAGTMRWLKVLATKPKELRSLGTLW